MGSKPLPTLVEAPHSPLLWGLCVDRSSQDWLWESAQVGELKFVTYLPVELAGCLVYIEKTCISLGADRSHHWGYQVCGVQALGKGTSWSKHR